MSNQVKYEPGPARGARVEKDGDKWTLVLVRDLHHAPEKVWQALTDPAHLHEWAPFEVDGSLSTVGTVNMTWLGAPKGAPTKVKQAIAPKTLEYGDMRWELEAQGGGTRLTLWHSIDNRYIAWGAAGWHIAIDVLDRQLAGETVARIAGPSAMQVEGWQRLSSEYAQQFGVENPSWGAR